MPYTSSGAVGVSSVTYAHDPFVAFAPCAAIELLKTT